MADISKCVGTNCPLKDNCKRFLAKAGYWQSYISVMYDASKGCDNFWPVKIKSIIKKNQINV